MKNGIYIVIEGPDGGGKSTQALLLKKYYERMKQREVILVEEPGGTEMADLIRKMVKDIRIKRSPEMNLALFTVARVDLWDKLIYPMLEENKVVISSRNYYSSVVYQGIAEGLGIGYVMNFTREALPFSRYLDPDIKILLLSKDRKNRLVEREGVDLEKSKDFFETKSDQFQHSLDEGYKKLSEIIKFDLIVSGKENIEEVHQKILKKVIEKD